MKIKEGFVIREVMGNHVVVAVGEASLRFRGMIKLNDTAADIWNCILEGMDESAICDALFDQYDVERSVLEADVKKTLAEMAEHGFLEL